MNSMFNRDEMIRLSREGMESSLRFFMTLNENVLRMGDTQREMVNDASKKYFDMINQAYEQYQKNNRVILGQIENMCRTAMEQTTTKSKENA
ncbi:hypothetical protein HYY75_02900 [bacterium]|nr:hypothetical protein [bacterium]